MIRTPFTPWTPPIRLDRLSEKKANGGQTSQNGAGGSSRSGGSQSVPSFESLFQQMLKHYMPETVEFTPLSEEELSETIRNWLRPAYEQAIQSRREQTGRVNAELDADAWSRGMGQSSYLSDVKERQFRNESRDVDALEGDYASTLAGHLYDAMKEQQKAKIEVDQFNAEQINRAREKAMSSAQALYRSYRSGSGRGGSSTGSGGKSFAAALLESQQQETPKTDYRTVANAVARMSPAERSKLYDTGNASYAGLRKEILYGLGSQSFTRLMRDFPGA